MTCQETAKDPSPVTHPVLYEAGSVTPAVSYTGPCNLPQDKKHLGYAELHPNPMAQSRCYQLGAMDVVHSPGHGPGQPALDGPA